ncbi:signal peptidase II [Schinkia azotoformans]|uniref:signal peptidase II n=1 Tax=Schinkia azotoformans TaxID=1454 RepID=UPI0023B7B8F3|nr:signal peptidase II [Schinkia azotoformans]MEC1638339.1 signal peptidase II [Schinkia azotoformans]MEC1721110.1 signal peptidase II [Schinkia azotoformans]MEC1946227.1 signal peptidase II [Schinkia azotoformans]MED4352938.1 signal peptidase II [Schinkia azotoformans]MED4412361.1 signal peptidase II [Schinkia azotoformans]
MGGALVIYYFIAIIVILIDQWSKWLVVKKMELGESITIIDQFFYLTSHRNRGAAWGILQGQMWFFYIITIIVIIAVIYYIRKLAKKDPLMGWSLGLILGGAIGNFIDRLIRKEVVDFFDFYLNFYFFKYNYPIFNVADAALVAGVILILIHTLLEAKKEKKVNGEV